MRLSRAAPGWLVHTVETIDSTNSALLRQAQSGDTRRTVLLADQQTSGRGRHGRSWVSTGNHQALTFSLGLALAPREWSGLSLVVGVIVAESLHPCVTLKWPNDLYWQGRKLGGILVETCSIPGSQKERYVVVGVGINMWPAPDFDGDVAAASVSEWRENPAPAELLEAILSPLTQALQEFAHDGFRPWQHRFATRDALVGLELELGDGRCGRALGIAEDGSLRIANASGEMRIHSGEFRVRPRLAAQTAS